MPQIPLALPFMDLLKIHFCKGNTKESESLRTYRFIYKMKQNLQSMRPQTLYYILKDIQTKERKIKWV